jgi:hypothetical protein
MVNTVISYIPTVYHLMTTSDKTCDFQVVTAPKLLILALTMKNKMLKFSTNFITNVFIVSYCYCSCEHGNGPLGSMKGGEFNG